MKNILITGASGITGQRLSTLLTHKKYTIKHLSSNYTFKSNKYPTYYWNTFNKIIDINAFHDIDIIIHLAGTPINEKRWNKDQKNKILTSRINGTKLIFESIQKINKLPNLFIAASGINYYGYNNIQIPIEEHYPPGQDFLSQVTKLWELNVQNITNLGIRVVQFRTGIILDKNSQILKMLNKIINFYLGAPLGSGKQLISWIHLHDLCNLYIHAIENKNFNGIYNAVAPEQITNEEFITQLACFLNKPILLPNIPNFIIKLLYGEMSNLILHGNQISIEKLLQTNFCFKYPTLVKAFTEIYSKYEKYYYS